MEKVDKSELGKAIRFYQIGLAWTLRGHLSPALLATKNELSAAISCSPNLFTTDDAIIAPGLIILRRKKS